MKETELRSVLDRITDDLEPPGLAGAALAGAGRIRARRRGLLVSGAVVAVVVVVLVASRLVSTDAGPRVPDPVAPSTPLAPSPEPSEFEPQAMGPLTGDMVRDTLDVEADYPDDEDLPLPESLQPSDAETSPQGYPAVVVVQTVDGTISYLGGDGTWRAPETMPEGRLFPESLAGDGGALALRSESAMEVYSLFAGRAFSYDVAPVATTGLWANDEVGLFYDVPGPGGETREHEAARSIDSVAFPQGEGLANIAMDPRGNSLHEFVDDEYVVWSNFQDIGQVRRTEVLGDLQRPIAQEGAVAVVRTGLEDADPTAADGVVVIGADLNPVALLPVVGVDMDEVVLHDFVDDHTLLLEVEDRVVTWNHRTGELSDVATLPPGSVVSFAYWNLRAP